MSFAMETSPQNNQLQAILASISDGIIACDFNGNITVINQAAKRLLEIEVDNLVGQPLQKVFEACELEGQQQIAKYVNILHQGPTKDSDDTLSEREVLLEIGERTLNVRLTLTAPDTKPSPNVVMLLRDVTVEIEAARTTAEFVSIAAHELRTPMTSIKGYTALLRQGVVGDIDDKQDHFLAVIQRNVNRLSVLINDLLDFSRIEAGKVQLNLRETQLLDLVNQVTDTLFISAQDKGLAMSVNAPPDLPLIRVDEDRVTQILTNLIGNAIAYTEKGNVTISLRAFPDTVSEGAFPDAIEVEIRDTGVGISQEDLAHIFERFYRADDAVVQSNKGTGLGLPIVKSFVEMHGGRIWVDSKMGEGTAFIFLLPLVNPDDNDEEE